MSDKQLQRSGVLEQHTEITTNNDSRKNRAVKISNQGKQVKLNDGKALCLLARDYKGFGNQEMNGVIEWTK